MKIDIYNNKNNKKFKLFHDYINNNTNNNYYIYSFYYIIYFRN